LIDGKYFYSSSPECVGLELVTRIGAQTVDPLAPAPDGESISAHIRMFGKQRTDK